MVDSLYRTKTDNENTTVGGASMGGLISFMLHWDYNHIIGNAVCMSSAFQYQDFDYVEMIKKDEKRKQLNVYIDNGDLGLENELQAGNDAMLQMLNDKGYKLNEDYYWLKARNAKHFEKDWGIRMVEVFKLFYGN
jgi:predicted alpha/beta superfamily hydrolase